MKPFVMPGGAWSAAFAQRLETLDRDRFPERLWARDPGLWSDDPKHQDVARQRLGWLGLPESMRGEVAGLEAFAREVVAEGFTHAVLLGMGGSSLAPEVLAQVFGRGASVTATGPSKGLRLTVLDSTSPAAVRDVAARHDPERTLFVVSSKSGTTIEVTTLERYFHEWVRAARGDQRGRSFVAITDPGTALERLAKERRYRRVFSAPPDVGGRYSALTVFGMVPAALAGIDVAAILDHARAEAAACGPDVAASEGHGYLLGAALGELAAAGRDKLTLVLGRELAPFGAWVEQLIAESTGKNGRGIVPVVGETLGAPEVYGADRVFVACSVDPLASDVAKQLDSLEHAGHLVLRWRDSDPAAIGAEFLRWEIATATAAAVIRVDPFDEPNVAEAKQTSKATLERYLRESSFPGSEPLAALGDVHVEAPLGVASAIRSQAGGSSDPVGWASAFAMSAGAGDYIGMLAYFNGTAARADKLARLRAVMRDATRVATTAGIGPRYLHSTGQLHKGGPNTGVYLLFTADEGQDAGIPGERHGFSALIRAQALGDYQVLERHERRVMRVHLGADVDASLERLIEGFGAKVGT